MKSIDLSKALEECNIDDVIEYLNAPEISHEDKYARNIFVGAAMQADEYSVHENEEKHFGYIEMMIRLMQSGYDINHVDEEGYTGIHNILTKVFATGISMGVLLNYAKQTSPEALSIMINELSFQGVNAIHYAILTGKYNTLNLLLNHGGDANIKTGSDVFPMEMVMHFCKINKGQMVYVLSQHDAQYHESWESAIQAILDTAPKEDINEINSVAAFEASIDWEGNNSARGRAIA